MDAEIEPDTTVKSGPDPHPDFVPRKPSSPAIAAPPAEPPALLETPKPRLDSRDDLPAVLRFRLEMAEIRARLIVDVLKLSLPFALKMQTEHSKTWVRFLAVSVLVLVVVGVLMYASGQPVDVIQLIKAIFH